VYVAESKLQSKALEVLVVGNVGVDASPDDLLGFFAEFLSPLGVFLFDCWCFLLFLLVFFLVSFYLVPGL